MSDGNRVEGLALRRNDEGDGNMEIENASRYSGLISRTRGMGTWKQRTRVYSLDDTGVDFLEAEDGIGWERKRKARCLVIQ